MVANRAVDLLGAFMGWAERRGFRPRHSNPCVDVERYPERKRSLSMTRVQYGSLGAALDRALTTGLPPAPRRMRKPQGSHTAKHRPKSADVPKPASPITIDLLGFLALSGWRESEALTLRWDALDLEHNVARLADTKTGKSVRALGGPAVALLQRQERLAGNPYVFPGRKVGSHLADTRHTWQSVKHAAGIEMRLHDLRHSFTTVARSLYINDHVIARLVGHTLDVMTAKYGDVPDELVQHAAHRIANQIEHLLSGAHGNAPAFRQT